MERENNSVDENMWKKKKSKSEVKNCNKKRKKEVTIDVKETTQWMNNKKKREKRKAWNVDKVTQLKMRQINKLDMKIFT